MVRPPPGVSSGCSVPPIASVRPRSCCGQAARPGSTTSLIFPDRSLPTPGREAPAPKSGRRSWLRVRDDGVGGADPGPGFRARGVERPRRGTGRDPRCAEPRGGGYSPARRASAHRLRVFVVLHPEPAGARNCRWTRRSSSVVPPQTPASPVSNAHRRHGTHTGHVRQICNGRASWRDLHAVGRHRRPARLGSRTGSPMPFRVSLTMSASHDYRPRAPDCGRLCPTAVIGVAAWRPRLSARSTRRLTAPRNVRSDNTFKMSARARAGTCTSSRLATCSTRDPTISSRRQATAGRESGVSTVPGRPC